MTFGGEDSEANAFGSPDTPVSEASTWSQARFAWNATSKLTEEMISLPAHKFKWGDDGKISEEYHFYDTTAMVAAIAASSKAE